jgi:uncharacterized membrane protein (UPF0127 family)
MHKSSEKKNHLIYVSGLISLFSIITLFFLYNNFPNEREKTSDTKVLFLYAYAADEPRFTKEGELTFLSKTGRGKIIHIDIEIAGNDYEREKGLMYRHSLPDNAGMLFIFDRSGPLSFWMRNTYISLDIIFADENRQIVTIQKNTKPLSYVQVPSKRNSKYVVEVNAGFCDKYGIVIGDFITF